VVCGLCVTIATFSPTKAFSSVDFPALGRPMMETKPEWKGMVTAKGAVCRIEDFVIS
jgi:hypothetical protein